MNIYDNRLYSAIVHIQRLNSNMNENQLHIMRNTNYEVSQNGKNLVCKRVIVSLARFVLASIALTLSHLGAQINEAKL